MVRQHLNGDRLRRQLAHVQITTTNRQFCTAERPLLYYNFRVLHDERLRLVGSLAGFETGDVGRLVRQTNGKLQQTALVCATVLFRAAFVHENFIVQVSSSSTATVPESAKNK
jgi:hypothetical protein